MVALRHSNLSRGQHIISDRRIEHGRNYALSIPSNQARWSCDDLLVMCETVLVCSADRVGWW